MSDASLKGSSCYLSLTVNDLPRSMAFYIDGFGFEVTQQVEHEGVLRFARLQAGDVQLGVGQDDFAKGRDRTKGVGCRLWIMTTQDLGKLAAHARTAGITLQGDPEPLPWGPMAFAFTDPDGFQITISNES